MFETNFKDLKLFNRGKVRDIYDFDDKLLIVSTDRLSAFDVIMPDTVKDKGKILNQISLFWFKKTSNIIQNHVITSNVDEYPEECLKYKDELEGRSVLVKKTKPLPVECIIRGYLAGSGWKDYQETGQICGINLPKGMKKSEKLPKILFTPSTKEEMGNHDVNISYYEMKKLIGKNLAELVKIFSETIFKRGMKIAEKNGIIIADTKLEFGLLDGQLILIDEVLTPDSSRFWLKEFYKVNEFQIEYNKQFIRDYLNTLDWNKKKPGPNIPQDILIRTSEKYKEIVEMLKKE